MTIKVLYGFKGNHQIHGMIGNGQMGGVCAFKLKVGPKVFCTRVSYGILGDIYPKHPFGGLREKMTSVAFSARDVHNHQAARKVRGQGISV